MPRFLFWSDLHMEFAAFTPPAPSDLDGPIDGLLLGGDITSGADMAHLRFATEMASLYGVPVALVAGNHEYYGTEFHDFQLRQDREVQRLRQEGHDIHLLSGRQAIIAGVRIIGATLWTDFQLRPELIKTALDRAEIYMADYRHVIIDTADGLRRLKPIDTIAEHQRDFAAITGLLSQPYAGPTIVLTHHLPISQAVDALYAHDSLTAAFASNLMGRIRDFDFDVWIYGHSHIGNEIEIFSHQKSRRFLTNQRGYPHEVTLFDPKRCINL